MQTLHDAIKGYASWPIEFMDAHPIWVSITSAALLIAFQITGIEKIKHVVEKGVPLNQHGLTTFLNVLEKPVQAKLDRFSFHANEIERETQLNLATHSDCLHLFCKITQPVLQMENILEAIYYFFKTIDSDDAEFKVVLYFTKDDVIQDDPVLYYPKDCKPNTPVSILRKHTTPIMATVTARKPTIISDIKNPPSGIIFARSDGDDREGSLLCYPVIVQHMGEVRMVISIFVPDKPGYFAFNRRPIYDFVLIPFVKRLVIEYGLLTIKRVACRQGGGHG